MTEPLTLAQRCDRASRAMIATEDPTIIDELVATIARLTADNKALTAERDDLAIRAATIDEALTNAIHLRRAAEDKLVKVDAELSATGQKIRDLYERSANAESDRDTFRDLAAEHENRAERLSAELAEARKTVERILLELEAGAPNTAYIIGSDFLASKEASQ